MYIQLYILILARIPKGIGAMKCFYRTSTECRTYEVLNDDIQFLFYSILLYSRSVSSMIKLSFAMKFDKVNQLHYGILLFNGSDNIDDADVDDRSYEETSLSTHDAFRIFLNLQRLLGKYGQNPKLLSRTLFSAEENREIKSKEPDVIVS